MRTAVSIVVLALALVSSSSFVEVSAVEPSTPPDSAGISVGTLYCRGVGLGSTATYSEFTIGGAVVSRALMYPNATHCYEIPVDPTIVGLQFCETLYDEPGTSQTTCRTITP